MRILITNDDGLHAPGLQSLADRLRRDHDIFLVAPTAECSNCGHCVTVSRPLACTPAGEHAWLVDGFPADCIRIARYHLRLEVDFVISGINPGGNLGVDIAMSGTCAGAREAAICGWHAVAISQVRKAGIPLDWQATVSRAVAAWQSILERPADRSGFWNINLPAIGQEMPMPPIAVVPPETAGLLVSFEPTEDGLRYWSDYHSRPRDAGSDVDACFNGAITASRVPLV